MPPAISLRAAGEMAKIGRSRSFYCLDTSVWLHRFSPACEWLLIEQECTVAAHGLMGVSGRVWDTDGGLLASGGAQLCCVPGRD
jgi:acyl-CoA thioesterase